MSIKEFIDHWKEEGKVVKEAPLRFWSSVGLLVILASIGVFFVIEWHYSERISTITEERDKSVRENEKLRDENKTIREVETERDNLKGQTNILTSERDRIFDQYQKS